MKIFAQKALIGGKFEQNILVETDGKYIVSVREGSAQEADRCAPTLTPGLFDKHNHGALGFEALHPDEKACANWLNLLAKHGVTNCLYTTETGTPGETSRGIAFCADVMRLQAEGRFPGACLEGVHMEGPFINPVRGGAMALEKIQSPSVEAFLRNTSGHENIVRAITIAPELEGAPGLSRYLSQMGVRVQAGHTDATVPQAKKAFREDAFSDVTHFYNAARPMTQRDPGILALAMLVEGISCEAICDFIHVAPEMLKILIKVKGVGGVCMISDSVSTAGLPDGTYGSITVKDGRNYSPSGGIAGASDQLDAGVRNLISIGFAPEDVFQMASANPAKYLGMTSLGDIRPGMRACLAAWDENYECLWSLADGALTQA